VTADSVQGERRMRLRYAGSCRLCGEALPAGREAVYERETKTVRCVECPQLPAEPEPDVAGGSARREYERRKNAREERIRAHHPKLGGLILALSDEPQSTRVWERGAVGEELLAEWLKDLPDTVRVLHDRRIPGSRANIDHIVVAPGGVWVIDAKQYKGAPALHIDGGFLRPRVESLRVGGRDKTKLVEGVRSQVARVTGAVADLDVPCRGGVVLRASRLAAHRRIIHRERHPCSVAASARQADHDRRPGGRRCRCCLRPVRDRIPKNHLTAPSSSRYNNTGSQAERLR